MLKDIIERYVETIFNHGNLRASFQSWLRQWFPEFQETLNVENRENVRDLFSDFIGTKKRIINNVNE